MFCTKCGSKNDKNDKFCKECGTKLEKKEEKPISEEQKKKDNKLAIIVVSVVVGLLLLGIVVYYAITILLGVFAVRTVEKGVNDAWKNIEKIEKSDEFKDTKKEIKKNIKDAVKKGLEELEKEDEEEDTKEGILETYKDGKVAVYLFRGQGCPHCTEAEEWFKKVKEENGDIFTLVDYEVWYNTENSDFMKKVAKARGENVQGVPYIIIGDKSWNGFTSSYEEEMLNKIKSLIKQ